MAFWSGLSGLVQWSRIATWTLSGLVAWLVRSEDMQDSPGNSQGRHVVCLLDWIHRLGEVKFGCTNGIFPSSHAGFPAIFMQASQRDGLVHEAVSNAGYDDGVGVEALYAGNPR